ncbi:hypothetical protein IH601_07910, partial [Candidatus Bipolaricaulota bacterium]|nr:hypothetical protein [Candidatus Bipolaricaulota bacterium]
IGLTVMDDDGLSDTAEAVLAILNTGPVVTECPGSLIIYNNEPVEGLEGAFFDPGADGWTGTVDWKDGTVEPITIDAGDQSFELPTHTYLTAPEGLTDYDALITIADDDEGSGYCTFTISVICDVTPPAVTLTTVPEPISNDSGPVIEWEGTDDFTPTGEIEYSYRLDGLAWSGWSLHTWAELDRPFEGDRVFEVRARDIAGNISVPAVAEWRTDLSHPIIHLNVPAFYGAYILNTLVVVDWTVSDLVTEVASASGSVASGSYLDTSRIGPYTFSVRATDLAGNAAEVLIPYFVTIAVQPDLPAGGAAAFGDAPVNGEPGAPLELWGFLSQPLKGIYDEEGNLVIQPLPFVRDEPISVAFGLTDALGEPLIYESGCVWIDVSRIVAVGDLEEYELVAVYEVPYDSALKLYACTIAYGETDDWWALTPGLYKLSLTVKAAWVDSLEIQTIWVEVIAP